MVLWIFRMLFTAIIAGVLFVSLSSQSTSEDTTRRTFWIILWVGACMGIGALCLDIFTPKKKLTAMAGVFFGLLVGMVISWVLSPLLDMINQSYKINLEPEAIAAVKWMMTICLCYLVIEIVVRTKDDIRFVIPYVEFSKQIKGLRPLVLDTSVIIDGRIADLYQSKLFDAPLIVPRFVLNELQMVADSADKLKRNRGRRGLDILNKMQSSPEIDIEIDDTPIADAEEVHGVDQKLVIFAKHCNGRLATTDYNLSKVAQLRNVDVVNVNDLANALKVVALPGETMEVRIIKPGEEAEQGIGYLADGTMVVVEDARNKIGRDIAISITSSIQTSAGKMVFGKFEAFAQGNSENGSRNPQRRPQRPYADKDNKPQ